MSHRTLAPSITVAIGRYTRLYFAHITTAPAELDAPATVTLHRSTFADLVGFAADAITIDDSCGPLPARVVLVDAAELPWQRAKCRGHHYLLLPADPVLMGLSTLQHWLWQRLQTPSLAESAA